MARLAMTGPDGAEGTLAGALRARGVEPLGFPLLHAEGPADPEPLREAAARLASYHVIAFGSPRAVDAVVAAIQAAGKPAGLPPAIAVGRATATRAREAGFQVLVEAEDGAGASGLLAALDGSSRLRVKSRTVLLPASERAREDLAEGLRSRGAVVEIVPAYTVSPAEDAAAQVAGLAASGADAALVASPSAAEVLAAHRGAAKGPLPPLLALGRTTAEAMGRLGLVVAATAASPAPEDVAAALAGLGPARAPSAAPAAAEGKGVLVSRPRRLRRTEAIRTMVRETRLVPECLVAPMFVVPGEGVRRPVESMPGVDRLSPDQVLREARALLNHGVRSVILFGVPAAKDAKGSGAADPEGPVPRAIRLLKAEEPDLCVWADVCLCEYTDHGHCGVLDERGEVLNDATLPLLARAAVACARAGADAVAPSDMMDGRVRAVRTALDAEGFTDTAIVSYAVKYASAFYGPFREAAGSTPRSGDRRGYQMDPANAREALREAALDEAEGADVILVKPALSCLDVVRRIREATALPVAAYNVSGEYAMLKAAAQRGWLDGERAMMEVLTSIRRAGADLVVTYHAKEAAALLA